MCGIAGAFSTRGEDPTLRASVKHLSHLMRRRGPDDDGLFADGQCALAARRLAVLDLSPAGHQPMVSHDGQVVLVYNGEVYNYRELTKQLRLTPRSTGDTEVVLQSISILGKEALSRLNGMFALAVYDTVERRLLLARDHAGIKPLYYMITTAGVVFGSQYDQILEHPWTRDRKLSLESLAVYLQYGYIPAPGALFANSQMLEPGTWLEVDGHGTVRQGRFFSFPSLVKPDLFGGEANEAVNSSIADAVRRQAMSDVPVGAFLSGGIDSPLVSAKSSTLGGEGLRTFTVANSVEAMDESPDAAKYARELSSIHATAWIKDEAVQAACDEVATACAEPFGDYSIFPTLLVSRLAKGQVTVLLSGDGGDELFWGYAGRMGSVLRVSEDFATPHP